MSRPDEADYKFTNSNVGLSKVFPLMSRPDEADYKFTNSNVGSKSFNDKAADGARWNVGYSSATLLTGNELDGNHYVGGSLSYPNPKHPTEILDDLRVRVFAMSDGTDNGIVVLRGSRRIWTCGKRRPRDQKQNRRIHKE